MFWIYKWGQEINPEQLIKASKKVGKYLCNDNRIKIIVKLKYLYKMNTSVSRKLLFISKMTKIINDYELIRNLKNNSKMVNIILRSSLMRFKY